LQTKKEKLTESSIGNCRPKYASL